MIVELKKKQKQNKNKQKQRKKETNKQTHICKLYRTNYTFMGTA